MLFYHFRCISLHYWQYCNLCIPIHPSNTIIFTRSTWMPDAWCNDYHFIVHFHIAEKVSTILLAFRNTLPCPHTVACIFKSCCKHSPSIGQKLYNQRLWRLRIQWQQNLNRQNHIQDMEMIMLQFHHSTIFCLWKTWTTMKMKIRALSTNVVLWRVTPTNNILSVSFWSFQCKIVETAGTFFTISSDPFDREPRFGKKASM